MFRKSAFTLSEVLITLVIIGVIAALTVPFIMNNTNKHEFRSALKKSISSLNQALEKHWATEGLSASDYTSADLLIDNVFKKQMNIVSDDSIAEFTSSECRENSKIFVTTDGIIYCVTNYASSNSDEENVPCNYNNTTPCSQTVGPNLYIDVNGLKKPNQLTTSSSRPKDIYQASIYSQRVIPYGIASQEVFYNTEMGSSDNNSGSSSGEDPNPSPSPDPKPEPNPDPSIEPDEPDPENPWYDQWDPNKWPTWKDFLNWLKNLIGGIFGY